MRDVHHGIASRVFTSIGPAAKPVQVIHDATAATIYSVVDGAIRGSLYGAGMLAANTVSNDGDETVPARPRVAGAIAAVNGIYGDEMTNRENGFAAFHADPAQGAAGGTDRGLDRCGVPQAHRPNSGVRARLVHDRTVVVARTANRRGAALSNLGIRAERGVWSAQSRRGHLGRRGPRRR